MKKIINYILIGLLAITAFVSCSDYYDDGGLTSTEPMKINTLEFLKSKPELFDTTLIILEKTGLDKVIASENVTFFAPQKKSILNALASINKFVVKNQHNKDSLGYTRDTVMIDDVPVEAWKKYMSRYIFKGQHFRDDFKKGKFLTEGTKSWINGGDYLQSYGSYDMFLLTEWTTWESVAEAGPHYIHLIDGKGTDLTSSAKAKYTSIRVLTSNLRTTSGVVHVLEKTHEFGFNSSGNFIPAK